MKFTAVQHRARSGPRSRCSGTNGQPDVRAGQGADDGRARPTRRRASWKASAWWRAAYEPIEPKFNQFKAPVVRPLQAAVQRLLGLGRARTTQPETRQDAEVVHPEPRRRRRRAAVRAGDGLLRDAAAAAAPARRVRRRRPSRRCTNSTSELLAGETIRPDAVAAVPLAAGRSWQNPLAEKDGQPGVAFRWLEVEGPIYDEWPTAGHRLLFGDLPIEAEPGEAVEVVSDDPRADAERLLREFVARGVPPAGRRTRRRSRFLPVIDGALQSGSRFTDAMIAGYTAVLCSPAFLYLRRRARAARRPRAGVAAGVLPLELRARRRAPRRSPTRASCGEPDVLRAQTERLLDDPKVAPVRRAFLDYWLDLRKIDDNSPDAGALPRLLPRRPADRVGRSRRRGCSSPSCCGRTCRRGTSSRRTSPC